MLKPVTRYPSLDTRHPLPVTGYPKPDIRYPLFLTLLENCSVAQGLSGFPHPPQNLDAAG